MLGHQERRHVLIVHNAQRGFTLVEVMITLTVLALLITLGAPNFFEWLQNQKTRAATEAVLNGLQVARSEAVRRNLAVQFKLTAVPASDWSVTESVAGTAIQARSAQEGTATTSVTAVDRSANAATTVTFSPIGGITANADASAVLAKIDVSNTAISGSNARPLRVLVSGGGSLRMCDPAVTAATDPRFCPTTY